ncbi:MAG TPA: hypothetical protein VD993_17900 [Chitinophagaceae bacterium]|nr:hypothetical protein [Chitinophagaceae bacterium]
MKVSNTLVKAITGNGAEVKQLIGERPDWSRASTKFDSFFKHLSNKHDALWSAAMMAELNKVYFSQREKSMSNITLRTVAGMPKELKNDTKKIFLQIAEICTIFNGSHKVNFEPEELPTDFKEIEMAAAKTKGMFTYADPLPSIYKKTSLTFDYWVPKVLEWCKEVRDKQLTEWKATEIMKQEACTDFMRICLLFLSDVRNNPPVAKAEDRQAFLALFQEAFIWTKKAAKREDIQGNSAKLKAGFDQLQSEVGFTIPLESWSRISQATFIKALIK